MRLEPKDFDRLQIGDIVEVCFDDEWLKERVRLKAAILSLSLHEPKDGGEVYMRVALKASPLTFTKKDYAQMIQSEDLIVCGPEGRGFCKFEQISSLPEVTPIVFCDFTIEKVG